MFDRFINDLALRAKSATGASEEVAGWMLAGGLFAVTALIFLSLAAYAWLTPLYGNATAWLIVGSAHLLVGAAAIARCVSVRRHNRALALAQLELAAKQHEHAGWKIDPTYLAIGIEVVKIIGIRNIIPLVAGGLAAAGWAGSRHSKPNGNAKHQ
jgi:hypothetical protein